MNNKQTSVEWYAEQDNLLTISFLENKITQLDFAVKKTRLLEQSKAMHEKQSFEIFKAGQDSMEDEGKGFDQYYHTRFNKQE
jgi:hypothetical protein